MKKMFINISLRWMLWFVILTACSVQYIGAQSPFQEFNNQNGNSSQLFNNSPGEKKTLWGDQEAFGQNQIFNQSTRNYAPPAPDEPGSTCLPVPNGLLLLMGLALGYGLIVTLRHSKSKMKKV